MSGPELLVLFVTGQMQGRHVGPMLEFVSAQHAAARHCVCVCHCTCVQESEAFGSIDQDPVAETCILPNTLIYGWNGHLPSI